MTAARRQARILEVTSYPPPRAGWGVRVAFVKQRLEREGHTCVVLNIGESRNIPSAEYETVPSGSEFLKKVIRFSRRGFTVHSHANGDALKGIVLALVAQVVNLVFGRRCILTFHAGAIQRYFPARQSRWLVPLFWLLFAIPRRIICNSDAVKACIASYGVSRDKIVPIPAFSKEYVEFSRVPLPAAVESFLQQFPSVVFAYVRMRPLFYPTTLAEGMAKVMRRHPGVGLVLVGGTGHADEGVWPAFQRAVAENGIEPRICFVDDLDHDAFLTVMERSVLYLRTPITDGVASSVLEALTLGTPVVACENGARPAGVVTYPAEDADALAAAVEHVLTNRDAILRSATRLSIPDTVGDEVALLTS
jgi:glycosyltransferase involved in cell wall biosynthesis